MAQPKQVSIDYAVENYGIPRERILYANQLCPGLIDENSQGRVNLDRLGLATTLLISEMPSLGFKISPRFRQNISGWLGDSGLSEKLYNQNEILTAAYDSYLHGILSLIDSRFGYSDVVPGEDLYQHHVDFSLNGDPNGIYRKKEISNETTFNLTVLQNLVREFALFFCPLGEKKENALNIISAVEKSMKKSDKLNQKLMYFTRIVPNYHDREDLMGEYLLRLIDGISEIFKYKLDGSKDIADEERFMSWSNVLVRNLAISLLRRQKLMDFYLHNCVEREDYRLSRKSRPKGLDNDPSGLVYRQEVKSIVNENIGRMDPKYGKLIELRFIEKLKYKEIAEKLGIPIGTVQSRLHHALEKFKMLPEIAKLGRLIF